MPHTALPQNDLPRLAISSAHVIRQFARRGDLASARFLYDEIARRMVDRLRLIRIQPERVLDAGCGAGDGFSRLRALYPNATYTGLDHCPPALALAQRRHKANWLYRLTGKHGPAFVCADLAQTALPAQSQDLVWSNMALHWHPQPHAALAEWRRVLKVGGLAFFSCLGPGSLRELRQAIDDAGLHTATPAFVDMHDLGDALVQSGCADPVMDQETLTLTYRDVEKLLQDVRALGGNPALNRRASLVGRDWLRRLCGALENQRNTDGVIPLTIEVTYGHAWRATAYRAAPGEMRVAVSGIKQTLKEHGISH